MTLSIVLFLRALLFFALATSLAAGPVPQAAGPARPIAKEKDYLIRYPGVPWVRAINSLESTHHLYQAGNGELYFEVDDSGTLLVRFASTKKDGTYAKTGLYVVSSLELQDPKAKEAEGKKTEEEGIKELIKPFNLIRGEWRRKGPKDDASQDDLMKIMGTKEPELFLSHQFSGSSESSTSPTTRNGYNLNERQKNGGLNKMKID